MVRLFVTHPDPRFVQFALASCLCCAHKHIVNIMKVYIERKNMHVKLIPLHKKYRLYWRWKPWSRKLSWTTFMKLGSLLSVMGRHRSSVQLWYCESLQMDSEGRIIEVVLGTEFSDYDRRTGDNKTKPKNWCRQFAWKVGPRTNSVRKSSFRLWLSRSTRDREWMNRLV